MIFSAVFSVATRVGGCGWTIYARLFRMGVAFWKFSNNPPNSASLVDAMTFLVILYSTCMGPFYGGIDVIGMLLLGFGPRKNIYLICCMPLVLRDGMNLNRYVVS